MQFNIINSHNGIFWHTFKWMAMPCSCNQMFSSLLSGVNEEESLFKMYDNNIFGWNVLQLTFGIGTKWMLANDISADSWSDMKTNYDISLFLFVGPRTNVFNTFLRLLLCYAQVNVTDFIVSTVWIALNDEMMNKFAWILLLQWYLEVKKLRFEMANDVSNP